MKTVHAGADVEGCLTFSLLVAHRLLGDLVSQPLVICSDLGQLLCRCEFVLLMGELFTDTLTTTEANPTGEPRFWLMCQ